MARIEFQLTRNPALGARCQWAFAEAYFGAKDAVQGPTLPEAVLVLPMVFHRRTSDRIHRMKRQSGLAHALTKDPEIAVGLQYRVNGYLDTSLASLSIAMASGLLSRDADDGWPRFTPERRSLPKAIAVDDLEMKQMLNASKRLGWWFGQLKLEETFRLLHVRF